MTGSRVLVHQSIAERGIAERAKPELTSRLKAVRPGPAADVTSEMGPLIDKQSVLRVNKEV